MSNNSKSEKNNHSSLTIVLPTDIKEKLIERANKNCRRPSYEALHIIVECLTKQERAREDFKLFIDGLIKRKRKTSKQRILK